MYITTERRKAYIYTISARTSLRRTGVSNLLKNCQTHRLVFADCLAKTTPSHPYTYITIHTAGLPIYQALYIASILYRIRLPPVQPRRPLRLYHSSSVHLASLLIKIKSHHRAERYAIFPPSSVRRNYAASGWVSKLKGLRAFDAPDGYLPTNRMPPDVGSVHLVTEVLHNPRVGSLGFRNDLRLSGFWVRYHSQ